MPPRFLEKCLIQWRPAFVALLVRIGSPSGRASFQLLDQLKLSCAMWIPRAILLFMFQYRLFPRGKLIFLPITARGHADALLVGLDPWATLLF